MPKSLKRYYGTGDLHFITCSCYQRMPWLDTALRRNLFLSILEADACERSSGVIPAPPPCKKRKERGTLFIS